MKKVWRHTGTTNWHRWPRQHLCHLAEVWRWRKWWLWASPPQCLIAHPFKLLTGCLKGHIRPRQNECQELAVQLLLHGTEGGGGRKGNKFSVPVKPVASRAVSTESPLLSNQQSLRTYLWPTSMAARGDSLLGCKHTQRITTLPLLVFSFFQHIRLCYISITTFLHLSGKVNHALPHHVFPHPSPRPKIWQWNWWAHSKSIEISKNLNATILSNMFRMHLKVMHNCQ